MILFLGNISKFLPLRRGEGKSVEELGAAPQLQILGGPSIRSSVFCLEIVL